MLCLTELCLFYSTYNDICTMVDDMVTQNWAGIMGGIGTQIKAMLAKSGVTYNACPQPAQAVNIKSYSLHIPEIPKILSWFAAVSLKLVYV